MKLIENNYLFIFSNNITMSKFKIKSVQHNTTNLNDLAASLSQAFTNICLSGAVISTLNINNLNVTNINATTITGNGLVSQNSIFFTGIQVSGAIFLTNTNTNVSFIKTGSVVTLTIGNADNGSGLGTSASSMDIYVPVGNGGIPSSWLPNVNVLLSNNGTFSIGQFYNILVGNAGTQYVEGQLQLSYNSRFNVLDININPLGLSLFSGGQSANLYPTTISYIVN